MSCPLEFLTCWISRVLGFRPEDMKCILPLVLGKGPVFLSPGFREVDVRDGGIFGAASFDLFTSFVLR